MNSQGETELTHQQHLAIAEILSAPNLEEARRHIKVAKGTLYKWLHEPAFQAELKRQREAAVECTFERLKAGLTQAVDKLMELLQTKGSPAIQLRAAQLILDHGIKALELQDLERRLGELERRVLAEKGKRQH